MYFHRLEKLWQICCEPLFVRGLIYSTAAGTEHKQALGRFAFDFIVDVGANRGQFALISRKIFPKAKIVSFEPLLEPAQVFRRVFDSDPNVTLYPYAVGKVEMSSTIHIAKDDDSSSLLPITKAQSEMFPGTVEKETREVAVRPLSQLIEPDSIPASSLLKIDVQGYELEVLQGCEDIIRKFSHLYVECSFVELYEGQALAHQIIAWLQERNFILSGIHNLYYAKDGRAVQGDFLFSQTKA